MELHGHGANQKSQRAKSTAHTEISLETVQHVTSMARQDARDTFHDSVRPRAGAESAVAALHKTANTEEKLGPKRPRALPRTGGSWREHGRRGPLGQLARELSPHHVLTTCERRQTLETLETHPFTATKCPERSRTSQATTERKAAAQPPPDASSTRGRNKASVSATRAAVSR